MSGHLARDLHLPCQKEALPMERLPSRLGFHYFPTHMRYRDEDLQRWLPELISLGAKWVTLIAADSRCIPEHFLRGLMEAGIQPLLHTHLPFDPSPTSEHLHLLFTSYARWGVRFIALFDRPNQRNAWPAAGWTHRHLIERFLDAFLPLAEDALACGLTPILPPLEPGGDYWDTAFLQAALRNLKRRASQGLRENLALGTYAWPGNRPLDWGMGGPQQWPQTRPYLTPPGSQDQQGFRIFEWYNHIAEAELGISCPIFLLGSGARPGDQSDPQAPSVTLEQHSKINVQIAQAASELPEYVWACNFWLLNAEGNSVYAAHAWYPPDGQPLPAVAALKNLVATQKVASSTTSANPLAQPITHYLLLPAYDWGIADWHLEVARPFIKKYRPTTGFSLEEAALAHRVTVIGSEAAFSEAALNQLRAHGCQVERITGDGTEIASTLSTT